MENIKEEIINNLIKKEKVDTNLISDGFHTFGELYEHRITLFIAMARIVSSYSSVIPIWRCKTDKDWFILCIDNITGYQISYHLPMAKWGDTEFAMTFEEKDKPKWDGHTSKDVLDRLNNFKNPAKKI